MRNSCWQGRGSAPASDATTYVLDSQQCTSGQNSRAFEKGRLMRTFRRLSRVHWSHSARCRNGQHLLLTATIIFEFSCAERLFVVGR